MSIESSIRKFNDIILRVQNVDEVVDKHTEAITDITDTAGDLFTLIKAASGIYDKIRLNKFKKFLKGYSKEIRESPENRQENSARLERFLSNTKNKNHLIQVLAAVETANSVYCSLVLGYLASSIVRKEADAEYNLLLYIDALKSMNDADLEFIFLTIDKRDNLMGRRYAEFGKMGLSKDEASIEKYKVIVRKLKGWGLVSAANVLTHHNQDTAFTVTSITEGFFDLIVASGVKDVYKNEMEE